MVIHKLDSDRLRRLMCQRLGLSDSALAQSPALLAELCRYRASFRAPCSRAALKRDVTQCIAPLVSVAASESLDDIIDALLVAGDLVEVRSDLDSREAVPILLHLGAPQFIPVTGLMCILVGIEPDGREILPRAMLEAIERRGHLRLLPTDDGSRTASELTKLGLTELAFDRWARGPQTMEAQRLIAEYNSRLTQAPKGGDMPDLTVISPRAPVGYYKGRWTTPKGITGSTIARRPQQYGAPVWCYVKLVDGHCEHVLDLGMGEWPGCDEAWWLLAASRRGRRTAQQFRTYPANAREIVISVQCPLPQWVQRWFQAIGESAEGKVEGLLSYRVATEHSDEAKQRLREALWMRPQEVA